MPIISSAPKQLLLRLVFASVVATVIALTAAAARTDASGFTKVKASVSTAGVHASAHVNANAGCANADLEATDRASSEQVARATACLVNVERLERNLRSLRWHNRLERSSKWMANDMIEFGYFSHDRPGGPSFADRITRFGYGKDSRGTTLGENIAWSSAVGATARMIVDVWMDSPGHRANILRSKFKDQGVGVVYAEDGTGDYEDAGPYVVFVNQFGARY